jgi:hypothetical protein
MNATQNKILNSLDQLQKIYIDTHQAGHDNLFSWLGIDFFVDQVRHIILPLAPLAGEWQINEDGRIFATNKPLLFMFEPDSRHLPVTYFQRILADLVQNPPKTKLVPHRLGYFLTLMVAEAHYNPLALTTTFLAVAQAIEQKQLNENIFDLVPNLLIDIATANISEEESQAYKQANMARQIALMQEVNPDIVTEIDALLRENSMETTIDIIKNQMIAYLQTKIFFE